MSAFQTGIARIQNFTIPAGNALQWTHNLGVEPLRVDVLTSNNGAAAAAADVTISDKNPVLVRIANASGAPLTVDVWVHFEVPSIADGGIVPSGDVVII